MKAFLLSVLTGVALMVSADAQAQSKKLYFCSDYTATGEPVGVSSVWNISPSGGNVYMLYQNGGVNISTPAIYVYVDKLSGGSYKEYSTKSVVPDKYKNWVIYDYTFTEAGDYKITFLDGSKNTLATEYCTIKFKSGTTAAKTSGVTSDYYADSKVMFCENVTTDGDPITRSDVFNIGPNGGYVQVLVKNPKAMKTTEIIVDIWRGEGYAEFVETKRFTIEDSWAWTNFEYIFYTTGNYKFSVYNKEETFINTGYVTINRK
jgi:hypothetical protein